VEPGRFRVIEGNYETYLMLVERGAAAGIAESAYDAADKTPSQAASRRTPEKKPGDATDGDTGQKRAAHSGSQPGRKRKFPYRKVAELEAEIAQREAELEEYNRLLALPDTHRSGEKVRQLRADIARCQEALQSLYAHWEEAVELNW
jgi:ATP-binding cassette subfamily F protein 3